MSPTDLTKFPSKPTTEAHIEGDEIAAFLTGHGSQRRVEAGCDKRGKVNLLLTSQPPSGCVGDTSTKDSCLYNLPYAMPNGKDDSNQLQSDIKHGTYHASFAGFPGWSFHSKRKNRNCMQSARNEFPFWMAENS